MNPYQHQQFDCIKHINQMFPNEQSLVNIDSEILKIQSELSTLQAELQEDIHQHAIMQREVWKEVQQVDQLARGVVQEIQDIKQKAERSEELVYSMCKDIKSLDIAKRNLTFSITALKKFKMMLQAIEKLRESCSSKKYKDIAMLLEAIEDLSSYFKKFENIPQITEINMDRESIIIGLKNQLIDDFLNFGKGNSLQNAQDMQDACAAVETMGIKFKTDLVARICKLIIDPYRELFAQPENNNLENTERRYAWLVRALKDFDQRFPSVFPEYWGVHIAIHQEFANVTRLQITEILERKQEKEDVAVLMKALQQTLKFETRISEDLKKRYEVWVLDAKKLPLQLSETSKKFVIVQIPKFKGCISENFEPYLRPYVDNEERELVENIRKQIAEDEMDASSDLKVFNSSFYMFNYFKNMMKRSNQYSRSQVMFDIYRLIKRQMRAYSDDIKVKIERESKGPEVRFLTFVCFAVNTAEYCKETIQGLEESLRSCLDSPFSDQVDLSQEEDAYNHMMNRAIEAMLQQIDFKLEPSFQKMSRIPWETYNQMGDVSDYAKETKDILDHQISIIKDLLSETYLIFYLNKLVVWVNNKFINTVFKAKKPSDMALNQMILDIQTIKHSLMEVSKSKPDSKGFINYSNFVNKTLSKADTLLKLIQFTPDQLALNYADYAKKYPSDSVQADFDKILVLKGIRKQDYPSLQKVFLK